MAPIRARELADQRGLGHWRSPFRSAWEPEPEAVQQWEPVPLRGPVQALQEAGLWHGRVSFHPIQHPPRAA